MELEFGSDSQLGHNMNKDVFIHVRIEVETKMMLVRKLKRLGLSPSDFVRAYIDEFLKKD
jgi:antitoxin component of RelBE/YafQ-DinJ toxin-antitoxin module